MLKQTIKKWNQSIDSYNANNINEAINLLTSVDATSKINYNIGVMYIRNANYSKAVDYFTKSVDLDKYLAISYFMRGIAFHMGGDTSHAIVDYDESINRLRGHEHIDYKQLGLESKLLLAEILYNKALALGKAGGPLAGQAMQCSAQPSDLNFRELCKKLQEGNIQSLQIRPIPLTLLFKPPRVSEGSGAGGGGSSGSKPPTSPTTSSPPPPPGSYTLRTKATPPLPSLSKSAPTLPTPTTTTTTTSSSSSPYKAPSSSGVPKPPPLPSKKLPSRPISMDQTQEKITLKIHYNDRRMIQLTHPYKLSELKQKIEMKFEISLRNIVIKFQSSDSQFYPISTQADLDYAISYDINELSLFDNNGGSDTVEIQEETNPKPTYSSSYSSPSYKSTTTTTSSYNKPSIPARNGTIGSVANKYTPPSSTTTTTTNPVSIPRRPYGKTVTTASSLPNKKFGYGSSADD